jgi:hypothetical protein
MDVEAEDAELVESIGASFGGSGHIDDDDVVVATLLMFARVVNEDGGIGVIAGVPGADTIIMGVTPDNAAAAEEVDCCSCESVSKVTDRLRVCIRPLLLVVDDVLDLRSKGPIDGVLITPVGIDGMLDGAVQVISAPTDAAVIAAEAAAGVAGSAVNANGPS